MIQITDNFLDDKHYNDLTSLHIEYSKVHWYGESCSPLNSLQKLISLTHYSDNLSGATAWYNIRPINPVEHSDIDSYCEKTTHPIKPPENTFLYYLKEASSGGELHLENGEIINCVRNRLIKFPAKLRHRVRKMQERIIGWYWKGRGNNQN